jgi:ankyrin repeat protein
MTPLMLAAGYGHLDCLQTLLQQDANLNVQDRVSQSIFLASCHSLFLSCFVSMAEILSTSHARITEILPLSSWSREAPTRRYVRR